MNRVIKFRAWDTDNKQMIYQGSNVDRLNGVMEARFCFDEENFCLLVRHYSENEWYPVNNTELMQFTGLKDKNGKEIYEGDVVVYVLDPDKRCHDVWWDKLGARYVVSMNEDYTEDLGDLEGKDYEVIGNIFQHPNLLEGK